MKSTINKIALAISLLLLCGVTFSALAQKAPAKKTAAKATKAKVEFLAKGDGIEHCIVTGEKLENKNISGEFFGRSVYFCCNDCLETAQKNPAAYVKKSEAEQIAAVKAIAGKSEGHHDHHAMESKSGEAKFLGKGDGVETCPVTGEKVDKSVSAEINGRTVYVCCPGCLDKVKKNPELYLKPATK